MKTGMGDRAHPERARRLGSGGHAGRNLRARIVVTKGASASKSSERGGPARGRSTASGRAGPSPAPKALKSIAQPRGLGNAKERSGLKAHKCARVSVQAFGARWRHDLEGCALSRLHRS
jgi:hypothetical protein